MPREELLRKVRRDFSMIPALLDGTCSSKAAIRYGCAKILIDLSEEQPETLYPYMSRFTDLLDSKYRILTWNAMAIIANLAKIDKDGKFDTIFSKYCSFLTDEYMVTVANVVGNLGKIALAKPYLTQKITDELLKTEKISTTPHLTEECKRIIIEKAIASFDMFFERVTTKEIVVDFVMRCLDSSRESLRTAAEFPRQMESMIRALARVDNPSWSVHRSDFAPAANPERVSKMLPYRILAQCAVLCLVRHRMSASWK